MSYVAHDESDFAPPAEVEEVELYHPKTFIGKYIWSQDAKVIAIQYAITAIGDRLGGAGAVVADAAAAGVPDTFSFIDPSNYLQFVSMHGMIMVIYLLTALFLGGFRQLPHPADGRRTGHGVPLRQHGELLGLPVRRAVAGRELLRARRADRRRLDPVPAAGDPRGHAGGDLGHHPDARVPGVLHHRLHDGRLELRGDRAAGAHARHDDDAAAVDGLGHLHGHDPGAAGVSGLVRQRHHDDCST